MKTLPYAAMQEKYPLVLMSGGLDSTYLTYLLLKTSPVDVLYVKSNQGEDKIRMEQQAVKRLVEALNAEESLVHRIRERLVETVMDVDSELFMFRQVLPWMLGALKAVRQDKHSKVCFGYVLGDQALGWKTEIMTAWDNLCEILLGYRMPLEFPLMRNIKEQLIRGLPNDVRRHIWVCEIPKFLPPDDLTIPYPVVEDKPLENIKTEQDKPFSHLDNPNFYFPCGSCPACKRHGFVMENVGLSYHNYQKTPVGNLRLEYAWPKDQNKVMVEDTPPPTSIIQDAGIGSVRKVRD